MITSQEALRRLSLGEPAFCRSVMAARPDVITGDLDVRSLALLQLGSVISTGPESPLWDQCVTRATDAGLSFDEIVGALIALAPTIGLGRAVGVAPVLARALGYDIDAALDARDEPGGSGPGVATSVTKV
jgi:alkylhydroperoxidase/carboxymuconolactone decarboxylase family protein YurZ